MVFSVTRKSSEFVAPAEPTPAEILPLSNIDRVKGLRYVVRSIHVFKGGERAAKTIKEALSKALVPYYPFAGRFIDDPEDGEVKLACTGEGLWYVEAVADCSLEDVRFLDHPLMISEDELLPEISQEMKELINVPYMFQVTDFTCGGFVFGLAAVHTMADGLGAAQFLQAIGDMARGLPKPSINPIWARDLIPNPPKLRQSAGAPPPTLPDFKLQHAIIDLSADTIQQIKADFFHSTGKHCSTFDASVAKVWQARTRAARFEPNQQVHVCFFANVRHLLTDIFPPTGGYYGNCFYPVTTTATAERVAESNLVDVIRIVRDAKSNLPKEFKKWAIGDFNVDPFELTFNYNSLFVSDWTRLGFREVDYGWGKPVNVIPFAYYDFMVMAVIGTLPVPKQGTRIMTQCVKKEHMQEFQDEMRGFN